MRAVPAVKKGRGTAVKKRATKKATRHKSKAQSAPSGSEAGWKFPAVQKVITGAAVVGGVGAKAGTAVMNFAKDLFGAKSSAKKARKPTKKARRRKSK